MTSGDEQENDDMETLDPADRDLLDVVGRLLAEDDPVPRRLSAAADAAFGWISVDDELAELLYDSAARSAATAVRGVEPAAAQDVTVRLGGDHRLDLSITFDSATLHGFVDPVVTEVELQRSTDVALLLPVDEFGAFEYEFVGEELLRIRLPGRAGVTEWMNRFGYGVPTDAGESPDPGPAPTA